MAGTSFGATKTATVNGTTFAYREVGEGEPVVFVHGGVSDLRTWEQQLPEIGRSYRAVAYSRRFCRPNEAAVPDSEDLSLVGVEDLAGLLQELGAAPAHLVGNSYGGYLSLVTAIRHPELVRTLVIEEPPVIPLFVSIPPRPAELLPLLFSRPRTALGILQFGAGTLAPLARRLRRGQEEAAARVFARGVLGKKGFDRLSPARWDQILENLHELQAFANGAEVFPPIDDEGVRGIRAPVLLVTGDQSPSHLVLLTDRLEELLPNAERIEIPHASHLMHEDNAPAVNEAIVAFIERHRAAAV